MSSVIKLKDLTSEIFEHRGRKVVPSQFYAEFCGKPLKLVNQAVKRLDTKNRLLHSRDYFHIFADMVADCNHLSKYVDKRYGGIFLTRKAVNTLSHYFEDSNSITLSHEVNGKAAEVQDIEDIDDPLISSLQKIIQVRKDQIRLEEEQKKHAERIQLLESKVTEFDSETGYRTVVAFSKGIGVPVPTNLAQVIGRKATKYCKEKGLSMGKVSDERWGSIKSYPIKILNDVFSDMGLIRQKVN